MRAEHGITDTLPADNRRDPDLRVSQLAIEVLHRIPEYAVSSSVCDSLRLRSNHQKAAPLFLFEETAR
jgi:hypothetical protein